MPSPSVLAQAEQSPSECPTLVTRIDTPNSLTCSRRTRVIRRGEGLSIVEWRVRSNGANKPFIRLILSRTGIKGFERIRSRDAPCALEGSLVCWNYINSDPLSGSERARMAKYCHSRTVRPYVTDSEGSAPYIPQAHPMRLIRRKYFVYIGLTTAPVAILVTQT